MRIESTGINMQNFKIEANTSIVNDNEAFSEIIDELYDEMSKTDADAAVLHALNGMDKDLLLVAKDDEFGRKLQDLGLVTRKRAPKDRGGF